MTLNTTGWTAGAPDLESECLAAADCLREAERFIARAQTLPLSPNDLDVLGAAGRLAHAAAKICRRLGDGR